MSRDPSLLVAPASSRWLCRRGFLLGLLALISLYDLTAPPISPTILRQTQTFSQTVHFIAGGFSPAALTIDIDGPKPFRVVYEFPLYQAVVGALFGLFGPAFFWGKLVSLLGTLAGFRYALEAARRAWGEPLAFRAGLLFATCPIVLLVGTAFQPDALALALTGLAGWRLQKWREQPGFGRWLIFLVCLLSAALTKFTVVVPFVPLLIAGVFWRQERMRGLTPAEWAAAIAGFAVPFVAWNLYRAELMDPRYLVGESNAFFIGDLTRFMRPGFYVKPAFIVGAMVLCGAGIPAALAGCRGLDRPLRLLLAGVPFYYVLLPTAAEQTYYAWPLVPVCILLAARGLQRLEESMVPAARRSLQVGALIAWAAGFAVAAPYTLRQDRLSLEAARAVERASQPEDLVLVANLHDRGVGIGGFNPTIVTLAGRRGWNVELAEANAAPLRRQAADRRASGARWMVVTWFSPELDPWFAPLLPSSFSRQPRLGGVPVDGQALAEDLARDYPAAAAGAGFVVLRLN